MNEHTCPNCGSDEWLFVDTHDTDGDYGQPVFYETRTPATAEQVAAWNETDYTDRERAHHTGCGYLECGDCREVDL